MARRGAFTPEARRALRVLVPQRFIINTGARMVFSFLPALARGSGLSVTTFSAVLFARDLTGVVGPVAGRISRRLGSWRVMTLGAAGSAIGMLLASIGPVGIAVGLVLWGVFRSMYLVGINSWIGDVVAYERRGHASGLVELTWAGAALVGLPLTGLAIDTFGWRAAPLILGLAGLPLTFAMTQMAAPEQVPDVRPDQSAAFSMQRSTLAALVGFALLTAAAQFLFLSHGLWLEDTYGFDPAQIGFAIGAVGAAEFVASYATSLLTDRLGKKNAVIAGTAVMGAALLALTIAPAPPLAVGLTLLMVAFLGFEFGIVSSIPMVSELEPAYRSEVVGRSVGLMAIARAAATFVAGWLYVQAGFAATMAAGTVTATVAIMLLVRFVAEPTASMARND